MQLCVNGRLVANEEGIDVVRFCVVERRMRGLHCELRIAVHEALLGVVVERGEGVDGWSRVGSGSSERFADDKVVELLLLCLLLLLLLRLVFASGCV